MSEDKTQPSASSLSALVEGATGMASAPEATTEPYRLTPERRLWSLQAPAA